MKKRGLNDWLTALANQMHQLKWSKMKLLIEWHCRIFDHKPFWRVVRAPTISAAMITVVTFRVSRPATNVMTLSTVQLASKNCRL